MTYYVERSGQSTFNYVDLHGGSREIAVRRLFGKKHSWNIDLDIWEIPPGTSEGSHIHDSSDLEYGYMDEIYLILEGQGTQLEISDDETIAIELRPFEIRTLRFTRE